MTNNKIIGFIAITINLSSIFYKVLKGYRAGWEVMLPIVIIGLIFTIISTLIKRNTITWVAIASGILSVFLFLLEQFILLNLFK